MPARQARGDLPRPRKGPLTVGAAMDDVARQLSHALLPGPGLDHPPGPRRRPELLLLQQSQASYCGPLIRSSKQARCYHDNKLGTTPMEYFAQRGFGYGAQPGPHLKVDESTSPDQCLRIYWEDDSEARRWTITGIGRHA